MISFSMCYYVIIIHLYIYILKFNPHQFYYPQYNPSLLKIDLILFHRNKNGLLKLIFSGKIIIFQDVDLLTRLLYKKNKSVNVVL